DTTPIIQYSRRARIAQSSALPTIADEHASPVRDISEGEACPTASGFIADQDRATIAKLKERVQALEDREGVASKQSREDASIKGRSNNGGEAAAERISNDSEEIARVLTSIDVATVLAGEIDVLADSGFIPTAGSLATIISTGSEVGPTASPIVTRRKGKEVMVESDTPKKKKLQKQIDAQLTEKANDQEAEKGILYGCDQKQLGLEVESERLKKKGINLEMEQVKKQKSSEEAPEIKITTKEFTEEKIKEIMQLVPVEDVYVQSLQVKHPIIDWKVHSEGQGATGRS
nr:hypothetical protein [Tanacetum cinerariifolium]